MCTFSGLTPCTSQVYIERAQLDKMRYARELEEMGLNNSSDVNQTSTGSNGTELVLPLGKPAYHVHRLNSLFYFVEFW